MPLPRQTCPSCGGFFRCSFLPHGGCAGATDAQSQHGLWSGPWFPCPVLNASPHCPWPSWPLREGTVPLSSRSGSRLSQRVLGPPLVPDTHRLSRHGGKHLVHTRPSEKGLEGVPGVGVLSVSQTMPGTWFTAPRIFAESLHVPLFVSCCPQGPGLQDNNLALPLEVEGRVRGGGEGPAQSHFDKTAGNPGA